jgi:hypothetical protein
MSTPGNAINESTTGICGFTGTAFVGTAVTNHNVLLGASTSSTLTNVAPSATAGIPLVSNGSSSDPSFTTAVVAGGGTGRATLTAHGVLVGNGTTAITQLAAGSAGQVLQSGGAAADPAYSTATYPSTASSTGVILRANGTNWVATTATYPTTTTVNQILYSSSANVVGGITTANDGILITSNSGVPSFLANGTTGQVLTATTGSPPSWASPSAINSNGMWAVYTGGANVTGDNTYYQIIYDTLLFQTGTDITQDASGNFTVNTNGTYIFTVQYCIGGSVASNTLFVGQIGTGGVNRAPMIVDNPGTHFSTYGAFAAAVTYTNTFTIPMTSGDVITAAALVSGSVTKTTSLLGWNGIGNYGTTFEYVRVA